MYFDEPPLEHFDPQKGDTRTVVMSVTCLVTIFFFLYPVPIIDNASLVAFSLVRS